MSLSQVEASLLDGSGIRPQNLAESLDLMAQHALDYADIFFQSSWNESLILEDGIIKDGSFNIDRGVGVRAVCGEKTGFAYSDQLNNQALTESALAARSIAQAGRSQKTQIFTPSLTPKIYLPINPFNTLSKEDKITLMQDLDTYIRAKDARISQVQISISAVYEEILVAALDGTYASDIRPLVRLSISVLAEENGRRERGNAGAGGRYSYERFINKDENGDVFAYALANEAIRMAQVNLKAQAAPAGTMPVVLGAGWPGVLLHEAVGHGLEGDFNRRGSSVFSGRIGEEVTSPLCTIVDDATLADRRGSLAIDDEGTPGQYNVLIEKGVLKGYMQDKLNARLMGMAPTGNARRESYATLPMPRMTNTYMLAGQSTAQEIIESIDYGLYAPNFAGGQVDITSGKFVFSASEAYLVEKGKITTPVKGATLIGNGLEAMQQVSMVGNDLALDRGIGICGKSGQSVPVGVGQPTLKLDKMTVGGTE